MIKRRLYKTTKSKYVFSNPQGVVIQTLIPILQKFSFFPSFSPNLHNSTLLTLVIFPQGSAEACIKLILAQEACGLSECEGSRVSH